MNHCKLSCCFVWMCVQLEGFFGIETPGLVEPGEATDDVLDAVFTVHLVIPGSHVGRFACHLFLTNNWK